ncbi:MULTISPECIES: hypothetical protein [unclassified Methanoregula]|uniref:hypothetical protein n=1 Tax=unclassified Methanoregula TaxID=2649730 RepID=UPI0009C956B3|nr:MULTISPECIES: hypothetical protein [unclassified Methanoregula]OPX62652.1 MAG: Nitrite and sulphite reductase 4Fe-4S domain protein [Methanoregula sp. PtaB.Bin085]OPY33305.1 MAG: Nitrite and sulphite reductase 4Fe-4S domain protein [Methanoregula sp. PtaU1.Bin006]
MEEPGFFGTKQGSIAVAGDKGGGIAEVGRVIASCLKEAHAIDLTKKGIVFYRANNKAPERLGETIDRVGSDTFMKAVK